MRSGQASPWECGAAQIRQRVRVGLGRSPCLHGQRRNHVQHRRRPAPSCPQVPVARRCCWRRAAKGRPRRRRSPAPTHGAREARPADAPPPPLAKRLQRCCSRLRVAAWRGRQRTNSFAVIDLVRDDREKTASAAVPPRPRAARGRPQRGMMLTRSPILGSSLAPRRRLGPLCRWPACRRLCTPSGAPSGAPPSAFSRSVARQPSALARQPHQQQHAASVVALHRRAERQRFGLPVLHLLGLGLLGGALVARASVQDTPGRGWPTLGAAPGTLWHSEACSAPFSPNHGGPCFPHRRAPGYARTTPHTPDAPTGPRGRLT